VNKLSSILGAAAVIAIAVVFIVQFRPATGAQNADSGPTCAAEVHGSCINTNHFWASYYLLTYRGADAARLRAMGFRRQVVDGLIETWLLNQDAKRLGITVSDEDVSAETAAGRAHVSLPADKAKNTGYSLGLIDPRHPNDNLVSRLMVRDRKTNRFDAKLAEKDIRRRTRLSPTEFRDFQRQELIAARMRDLVRARVRVSEGEAYEEYARLKSTAQIDYIKLNQGFYADVALDTSPKAVEAFLDKNKEDVDKVWESRKSQFLPECRVTRHILVKVPDAASDEDRAEKKKRIEHAIERINKGEDFADVARAVSEDTSAFRGGDLGCVPKGTMVKPFEEAMRGLDEGKVSGVVATEYGFHVLKVEKIAKDTEAENLGRKQIALDLYAAYESDRLATEAAKNILAAVRGGKSLKDALETHIAEVTRKRDEGKKDKSVGKKADDKSGEEPKADHKPLTAENHPQRPVIETSSTFGPAGGAPIASVRPGTDLMKIIFALEKPGDVPDDIVPLENGYAVLELKDKKLSTREQFDKDRDSIIEQIRAAKQNDALIAYVKRLQGILASDVVYKKEVVDEPKVKPGEDSQSEFDDPLGE
jgi:peptidyl-prolyl cis-trans isomerase D